MFRVQEFMGTIEHYKIRKTMNCEHLNKVGSGFRVQGSEFRVREFMGSGVLYKIRKTMNFEHLNKVGLGFRVHGSGFRVQCSVFSVQCSVFSEKSLMPLYPLANLCWALGARRWAPPQSPLHAPPTGMT